MTAHQSNTFGSPIVGAMTFGPNSPASGTVDRPDQRSTQPREDARVLLITVSDVELDAIVQAITGINATNGRRLPGLRRTVYDLGWLSRTEIMVAQVGQGGITPDSAGPAAGELLDLVGPDQIIAVGMCYGLADHLRIGDVLVANMLYLDDHRRIAEPEIVRGGAVHPSALLLDRFHAAHRDRASRDGVRFGPMVSESKLVDSPAYREAVKARHPDALGGEMEGAAIYAAAASRKIDWGLVKAVSDLGMYKTDTDQVTAATSAATFIAHLLRIGGLDRSNQ